MYMRCMYGMCCYGASFVFAVHIACITEHMFMVIGICLYIFASYILRVVHVVCTLCLYMFVFSLCVDVYVNIV